MSWQQSNMPWLDGYKVGANNVNNAFNERMASERDYTRIAADTENQARRNATEIALAAGRDGDPNAYQSGMDLNTKKIGQRVLGYTDPETGKFIVTETDTIPGASRGTYYKTEKAPEQPNQQGGGGNPPPSRIPPVNIAEIKRAIPPTALPDLSGFHNDLSKLNPNSTPQRMELVNTPMGAMTKDMWARILQQSREKRWQQ